MLLIELRKFFLIFPGQVRRSHVQARSIYSALQDPPNAGTLQSKAAVKMPAQALRGGDVWTGADGKLTQWAVSGAKLYRIQAWVALPRSHEEGEPTFTPYGAESLPMLGDHGVRLRLIAGEGLGARSPVSTPMSMIYADAQLEAGASVPFDATYEELVSAGYEGHRPPWDAFWGQRYASLRDGLPNQGD